eukprot:GHVT01009064.1.p1 GENE.GHVT01009064.1~~GHVT01009064.1.p1  ORF type:complete len:114 (-),score=6.57 GHVT01009064.1:599-940(-)
MRLEVCLLSLGVSRLPNYTSKSVAKILQVRPLSEPATQPAVRTARRWALFPLGTRGPPGKPPGSNREAALRVWFLFLLPPLPALKSIIIGVHPEEREKRVEKGAPLTGPWKAT